MLTANYLIDKYQLTKHPEGGHYKETYTSNLLLPRQSLPNNFTGDRICSTAIYFLLEKNQFSAFHRIKSDECWHFYAGETLEIFVIDKNGELHLIKLGNDLQNGEVFQYVVEANCWFASKPAGTSTFSFVGCTVAPGFNFLDFELANAENLISSYPQHKNIIQLLCI